MLILVSFLLCHVGSDSIATAHRLQSDISWLACFTAHFNFRYHNLYRRAKCDHAWRVGAPYWHAQRSLPCQPRIPLLCSPNNLHTSTPYFMWHNNLRTCTPYYQCHEIMFQDLKLRVLVLYSQRCLLCPPPKPTFLLSKYPGENLTQTLCFAQPAQSCLVSGTGVGQRCCGFPHSGTHDQPCKLQVSVPLCCCHPSAVPSP